MSKHSIPPDRVTALIEAKALITGDRNQDYGEPSGNFRVIADMWSAYLQYGIQPHDVAAMMILLKISRVQSSPQKWDTWVDLAGYAGLGAEVKPAE